MAKIEWSDEAKWAFMEYVKNARIEFGETTAQRWLKDRKNIEWRLQRYPDSYPLVELLEGREILYRRCSMMNRRFQMIYFYDKSKETVYIVDIWDVRRNPKTLIRKIK